MRFFVTSDQHYGHGNIIKYANRPFSSAEEMNEELIRRFNERVKPEDFTFIIGDFCFKHPVVQDTEVGGRPLKSNQWLDRLNGEKIVIRGNHDNNNSTKTIIDCIHITYAGQRINLVHKPEHANSNFPINLVGHVHDKWKVRTFAENYRAFENMITGEHIPRDKDSIIRFLEENYVARNSSSILLNIGVDQNKFYPITLDEALSQIIRYKKGLLK